MVEITNENGIEVIVSDASIEADVVNLNELDIRVSKKEYTIVGDSIYIPKLYDDAPEWMKNLVQIVVDVSLETGNVDLINQLNSVLSEFATQYVPLNQYTKSILDLSNEDTRMNAVIETLNSNYNDGISEANAQIIELQLTKASKTEVVAQVLQTISAELQNGESDLGAVVARLDQAIADESSARAMSFETVMASMESLDGTVSGEASATSNLYAYVGYERGGSPTGTGLLADVQILQKQNDGVIETYTGTYDVMIGIEDPNNNTDNDQLDTTKEPYASWLAEDVANGNIAKRSAHVGDVYIKYSNSESGYKSYERAYKFIKTVVDGTSPYVTDSAGFTWSLIVDTDAQNAYVAALNAYDLADDKRRVFVNTPYAPIDEGDLWVTGTNPQVVKVYKSGNWVTADTQAIEFANEMNPKINSLQNQVDGQISYYFYDSSLGQSASSVSGSAGWNTDTLKKEHNGDIAYDTKLEVGYWYDRLVSGWVQITGVQNAGVIEALKKAAAAKEAADNVVVSYYAWKQTTAPNTQYRWMKDDNTLWEYVGSSWVAVDAKKDDTLTAYENSTKDTTLYVHNGSNWAMITPNGIVANAKAVTDLNANLNSLDTTVSGHTSLLNTVDTRIGSEGARVESKFAYNSTLVLNGASYNSGFGIATSLTSGSGLPTGQSEFWIKADKFKLMSADGSRKSSYSPFTVDSTTGNITFNGIVSFSNISNTQGSGTNLLYNSAPKIGNETKGWSIGWSNHGMSSSLNAGFDPWRPTGGASVYVVVPGNPGIGTVFDINNSRFPVVAGARYEASAYVSSHSCNSWVALAWFDSNGNYINEIGGSTIRDAYGGPLGNWGRSTLFAIAPSNAATAQFYVRSSVTSDNPYCFVAYAYAGIASANQTVVSNWSEGSSAGVSSSDVVNDINSGQTTTINGGKITTGSVTASQINTVGLIAENINAVEIVGKTITGGTIVGASITGVTIKASYLDLDGELEVLTNFYLCVNGNTTGVPAEAIAEGRYRTYNSSLDIDAIPSTTYANIYRIPTLSTVRETVKNINISTVTTESGVLYSYNTANVLTNLKSVKRSPVFTNSSSFEIFKAIAYNEHFGTVNYILSNKFRLKLGNIVLFECTLEWESAAGQWDGNLMYAKATYSGEFFTTINHLSNAYYGYYNYSANNTVNIGIGTLEVNVQCNRGDLGYKAPIEVTAVLNAGSTQFPGNWDSGALNLETVTLYQGTGPEIYPNVVTSNVNFKLLSSLAINNMI